MSTWEVTKEYAETQKLNTSTIVCGRKPLMQACGEAYG